MTSRIVSNRRTLLSASLNVCQLSVPIRIGDAGETWSCQRQRK